ncbi:ATP-binding protein [Burkholderia ambifaria]
MSVIATAERAKTAIELGESHFREFKSALEGRPSEKRKRSAKDIATDIAQTLVAFANADGGELLVGVEDNGEVTGLLGLSANELNTL